MKRIFLLCLFITISCDDSSSQNNNNNSNNTNTTCEGTAPLADIQDGICAGSVKICSGTQWIEPDYSLIDSYETEEITCDGVDNDCDGDIDEGVKNTYYYDTDNDGFGDPENSAQACSQPAGTVTNNEDCDDSDDTINPNASEACDGIDNNCNGSTDEGVKNTYYYDADNDGYGDPSSSIEACSQPEGTVLDNTDCDDSDEQVFPGNLEICDGKDNNCDGSTDEGLLLTFFQDFDGDGHGNSAVSITACSTPVGYVLNSDDCNDSDNAIFPGNSEICDGKDNNCDGSTDEGLLLTFFQDFDGDGHGNSAVSLTACSAPAGYVSNSDDCDDSDNAIFPGNSEICDGKDNNCNGSTDEGVLITFYQDADNDGHGNSAVSLTACSAPAGYVISNNDCDDSDNTRFPGNSEVCDGKDNNCNGSTDEGVLITFFQDADADGHGNSAVSLTACSTPAGYVANSDDCDDSDNTRFPGNSEVCDGKDNNCNGSTDEGVLITFFQDADADGHGNSAASLTACFAPAGYVTSSDDCDDSDNARFPGNSEICDGKDNDCNTIIDDNPVSGGTTYYRDIDADGYGDASTYIYTCDITPPVGFVVNNTDCNDNDLSVYPGALEICDGTDNNCNGIIDAGTCGANKHCQDDGSTVAAYCQCNSGFIEDPGTGECVYGTTAQSGDILITEIMITPVATTLADGQYFEILNRSSKTLELNTLKFVVNGTTLSAPSSPITVLGPNQYAIITRSADSTANGNIDPDIVLSSLPILDLNSSIRLETADATLLDEVIWTDTWRHTAGSSLSLSPGVISSFSPAPMTLNDNPLSWCSSDTVYFVDGLSENLGTPGIFNNDCKVDSCQILNPVTQHIVIGGSTEPLNVQVNLSGVTDSVGQGSGIETYAGYGNRFSSPTLSSWTWIPTSYSTDSGIYDIYTASITPATSGTFSFAFKVTMDGGYSWRYCDQLESEVYVNTESGDLLVDSECIPGGYACSNCIDDDGDGLVDGWDPECLKASDNDEGAFETGYPSDNGGTNLLDCYYDGDSGSGNDTCEIHTCCLLDGDCYQIESDFGLPLNTLSKKWTEWEPICGNSLPTTCIDRCLPSTPPGCDCFGCCNICQGSECHTILLSTPLNFSQCTQESFNDPTKCPTCTMHPECSRPCDPNNCELCPGMTPLDLPSHCSEQVCPDGLQICSNTADCNVGLSCIFGCCVRGYQ